MDLQITRNIEQLIALLRLPEVQVSDIIEIHQKPFGLRLEVQGARLMLTSWLLERKGHDLDNALKRNQPERFNGLPQRIFPIKSQLFISALCPEQFDAHQWFRLCQKQRQFLSQLGGGE
ncbi:hypothetical protein [Vibrio coralliilyticus]|uniref:hypothetical protein n=1 Tax=Vibrio coralliilyticus TaxID=190893 RepID=UPI00155FBA27|nr:hypothetical protein [Vibrio coralliilyticus]NRF31602.1 hypothetical protein [Vibrio coralliilyticus]NRF53468.1 hypothetical protein [Vibrio coralliilyticus]NRG02236.1 hypothetical protein [Vibrio coralliilyticus]